MLAEPPPTQADVHFRVAGFPVRVHPMFWVVSLLIGLHSVDGEPIGTIIGVAVVFVSILVHELGHAVVQRKFGGWPRIVLHGFGGLAICSDCDRSTRSQILISLAGPAAGFLLAAITLLLLAVTSGYVTFVPFWSDGDWASHLDPQLRSQLVGINLLVGHVWFRGFPTEALNHLFAILLWVNIFWGLMNLLPIYPLDGGQVARELFSLSSDSHQGIVRSLQLSLGVAVAVAVWGLVLRQDIFLAILFGYLAYTNYRTLQAYTGRGPGLGWR